MAEKKDNEAVAAQAAFRTVMEEHNAMAAADAALAKIEPVLAAAREDARKKLQLSECKVDFNNPEGSPHGCRTVEQECTDRFGINLNGAKTIPENVKGLEDIAVLSQKFLDERSRKSLAPIIEDATSIQACINFALKSNTAIQADAVFSNHHEKASSAMDDALTHASNVETNRGLDALGHFKLTEAKCHWERASALSYADKNFKEGLSSFEEARTAFIANDPASDPCAPKKPLVAKKPGGVETAGVVKK